MEITFTRSKDTRGSRTRWGKINVSAVLEIRWELWLHLCFGSEINLDIWKSSGGSDLFHTFWGSKHKSNAKGRRQPQGVAWKSWCKKSCHVSKSCPMPQWALRNPLMWVNYLITLRHKPTELNSNL